MKKLSIIMSGILAALFFLTVFFSMGNENYKTVTDFNSYFKKIDLQKEKGIQVYIDDRQVENKNFQKFLYTIFQKYNTTAIGVAQYHGAELQKDICYVYSDNDIYMNQINTKNNERINFNNSNENRYYTVSKNDNQGILIEYLNPMYYSFTKPYEIHPYHQAIGKRMPVLINIGGINELEFSNEISKSDYGKYIISVNELSKDSIGFTSIGEGIQFNSNKIMYICVILAFVSLFMLIIVEVIKHKKYIAVAKLNGISKIRIMIKVFSLFLLSILSSYAITSFILLYIISGSYREVNRELYKLIFFSIFIFSILIILLMILLYFYLWLYVSFHELKKNKMNVISINLNIIVKIGITSVLIFPFVSLASDTYTQVKETIAMNNMRKENKNRYIVNVYNDNSKEDDINLYTKVYTTFSKQYNGKVYNIFSWLARYTGSEESDETKEYETPLIIVNRNYLKEYNNLYEYDTKKKVNIDKLQGGVFIVPKSLENNVSLQNYENQLYNTSTIIVDELDKTLKPLYFTENAISSKYAANAIVYVMDEAIAETQTWGVSMYVDLEDLTILTNDLNNKNLNSNVILDSLLPAVELEFNKQLVTFTTMIFMMIGYLAVYLTFVYQSIFVYLDVYRKKLSVQYLHGYSYTKRYTEIYTINACAYVLAGIIAYAVFHVNIKDIVLYILFFGGIEVLFEAYQIRRFERKSGIRSLK